MNLYHSTLKGLREQREARRQHLQQHSHQHYHDHEQDNRKKPARKGSLFARFLHRH